MTLLMENFENVKSTSQSVNNEVPLINVSKEFLVKWTSSWNSGLQESSICENELKQDPMLWLL